MIKQFYVDDNSSIFLHDFNCKGDSGCTFLLLSLFDEWLGVSSGDIKAERGEEV